MIKVIADIIASASLLVSAYGAYALASNSLPTQQAMLCISSGVLVFLIILSWSFFLPTIDDNPYD